MAGAAAAGMAGGLALGEIIDHERDQNERLDRLEEEEREDQWRDEQLREERKSLPSISLYS
jgi:hypothetical protein